MKNIKAVLIYGFLSWLIPFIIAVPFYHRDGKLIIDIFLFKSIMIIIGFLSGAFLMILYFRKIDEKYFRSGLLLGLIWLFLNWILDFIILIPMSKMAVSVYFMQIGLRYLNMLIMAMAFGYLLSNKIKQ